MKAVRFHKYGSPDVLTLEEIDKPEPGDGEVLVKVESSSINAGDWHMMRGTPYLIRLIFGGLTKPKKKGLGADVAGRVEAVGPNVSRLAVGDEVFGEIFGSAHGAFSEYVAVPESMLVKKPESVPFEEAGALATAGFAALQAVRDKAEVHAGQKVLIVGASGGVGSFAVQIAKAMGAEVTALAGTHNVEMVRSLGADHVIDYKKEDVTKGEARFDVIIDAAAYRPFSDYSPILEPQGTYVMIGGSSGEFFRMMFLGSFHTKKGGKTFAFLESKPNPDDLAVLSEMAASGKIKPAVDRRYPLAQVADAIRYMEDEHAKGKVVIEI
ncbi:MAG: NAD(P)-dependent alcohol dehydrogenase [Deltaproteobacteria bacterium]|nr:NAD(P)-dependent alcohol dehydrogenase [Deltaproteobacteria bacterium]